MHTAIVVRDFRAAYGVPIHCQQLAHYLQQQGHRVSVLASDVENAQPSLTLRTRWTRPYQEFLKLRHPRRIFLPSIALALNIVRLHLKQRIHVLHVHTGMALPTVARVGKLLGMRVVFTVHSLDVLEKNATENKLYPAYVANTYQRALRTLHANKHIKIITVSAALKKQLAAFLNLNETRAAHVHVIHNGLGEGLGEHTHKANGVAAPTPRTQLPATPHFLFIGSLIPRKGVGSALQAFALFLKAYAVKGNHASAAQPTFTIVGTGPLKETLQTQAQQLGIAPYVKFTGSVPPENIAGYMEQASALLLPSLSEAQGIVVLEAFARGVPVIASNVGGIPEMLTHAHSGYLHEPGNTRAIAQHMHTLHNSQATYTKLSRNALNTAQNFHWEHFIHAVLKVYKGE